MINKKLKRKNTVAETNRKEDDKKKRILETEKWETNQATTIQNILKIKQTSIRKNIQNISTIQRFKPKKPYSIKELKTRHSLRQPEKWRWQNDCRQVYRRSDQRLRQFEDRQSKVQDTFPNKGAVFQDQNNCKLKVNERQ